MIITLDFENDAIKLDELITRINLICKTLKPYDVISNNIKNKNITFVIKCKFK